MCTVPCLQVHFVSDANFQNCHTQQHTHTHTLTLCKCVRALLVTASSEQKVA